MEDRRDAQNDDEWDRIKNKLPSEHPKEGKRGQPAKNDNRRIMNGFLWIARTGAPWRVLPERMGSSRQFTHVFAYGKSAERLSRCLRHCAPTRTWKTSL